MGPEGPGGRGWTCARCRLADRPGQKWDLDHDDEDPSQRRYLGPSHRRCNRGNDLHLEGQAQKLQS